MPTDRFVVVRGGGDIATGVVWRLVHAGFPVVVTELAVPLTVRRTVAVSSAILADNIEIEGMVAERARGAAAAFELARTGSVAVVVSPELPDPTNLPGVEITALVDARLAKINIDTAIDDAPTVIGLGPGFTAGLDCDAVVETNRGHHLGRVIWHGQAELDTGTPGVVGGHGAERVLRSPADGRAEWLVRIGDTVSESQVLGTVAEHEVTAPFDGVVRGLITPGVRVGVGLKIGDVDPRCDRRTCHEISDKALAVGGGVVEAVLTRLAEPTMT